MLLKNFIAGILAVGCLFSQGLALSAEYPDKPIKLVVPFAPGGTTDTLARVISVYLATQMFAILGFHKRQCAYWGG